MLSLLCGWASFWAAVWGPAGGLHVGDSYTWWGGLDTSSADLKQRNVLFNDALNTFYLRLYGVRHMVKDHSDSEKGNLLPPHRLLLSINRQQGFFYVHHPTDRITHNTAFVKPVVEHWLEREIAQWVHPMKDRSDDPSHHERTLYLWATSRSPDLKQDDLLVMTAPRSLTVH